MGAWRRGGWRGDDLSLSALRGAGSASAAAPPEGRGQPAIEDPNAEAHLFIWVYLDDPRADASSALRTSDISEVQPPDLHGVDTVWISIDLAWVPADLIRLVADKTDIGGIGMPRLTGLPICRLTDGGWERYTCEWRPGAEKDHAACISSNSGIPRKS